MPVHVPTILIVEDDLNARKLAFFVLQDAGYHVLEAANASQALTLLVTHPDVDLVFSDVQMPGDMNGIALTIHLQQQRQDLRVLLTSAWASQDYADYPSHTPFLGKPYTRMMLLKKVSECLNNTHAPRGTGKACGVGDG